MKTISRNGAYGDMRLLAFAGTVFGIASFLAVVIMWFIRMLVL